MMVNHPRRARKAAIAVAPAHNHDVDYQMLLNSVADTFRSAGGNLFTTNAEGLWAEYLDRLPSERQVHLCSACRRFVEAFGGLVCIGTDGTQTSALWNSYAAPQFYQPALAEMARLVERARITGPFLSKERVLGTPVTRGSLKSGSWTHLSVELAEADIHRDRLMTPFQAMAAKREDFRTVATALAEFTPDVLAAALRLLEAETLPQAERFIGPVRWLKQLHERRAAVKGRARDNILWSAVATAPNGYCHPRASVVGALLTDLAAGLPFETVRAKFSAMVHPLQYQRPQAAPTIGNVKRAEEIVAKLGIAPSLERRFARLDDLQTLWMPPKKAPAESAGGVFAHLQTKRPVAPVITSGPAVTVTWEKFARVALPMAETIDFWVPVDTDSYIALTTAVNVDAPPILKWDRDDERNPVAWYVYPGGSPAHQWKLTPSAYVQVTAIAPLPTLWGSRPSPFLGEGVVLVLDGCVDTKTGSGNALFPSCLRDDLHKIRSTVEAYSRNAELSGREEASACGYDVRKGQQMNNVKLRVTSGGVAQTYVIDRWD